MDLASALYTEPRHRVAILIDGDNFPRADVAKVEASAHRWGDVTIRRVFGDMALHKDWAQDLAYTCTHSPTTGGKNRADMLLVVAAMDFAHRALATAFVIVSDDRDFAPLINHLREQGHRVDWLGKGVSPPKTAAKAKPKTVVPAEKLIDKVKGIVGKDGCPIQSLGPAGQKLGIKISDTPQKTWRAWLLAHASEFVCEPRGPDARVRLKG